MSALPHAGLRADSVYYDVDFDVSESAKPFDKANEALASHQEGSEGIEAIHVADSPDLMKFVADSPGLMKSDNSEEDMERDHIVDEITRGNPRRGKCCQLLCIHMYICSWNQPVRLGPRVFLCHFEYRVSTH
jgi:hypothetical protein